MAVGPDRPSGPTRRSWTTIPTFSMDRWEYHSRTWLRSIPMACRKKVQGIKGIVDILTHTKIKDKATCTIKPPEQRWAERRPCSKLVRHGTESRLFSDANSKFKPQFTGQLHCVILSLIANQYVQIQFWFAEYNLIANPNSSKKKKPNC